MRIISGKHKGRIIGCPEGQAVRPTSDMARSAIFNIIQMRVNWPEAKVLDLFCGTGALGLEAISRGAAAVTFVDNANQSIDTTKANLLTLRETAEVIRQDATQLGDAKIKYDLVFIDPPYRTQLPDKLLQILVEKNWLNTDAIVVVEVAENQEVKIPAGLEINIDRNYGNTRVLLLFKQ